MAAHKKELVPRLAIIGGTGLAALTGLQITHREVVNTPFGPPSGPLLHGLLFGKPAVFLARHGYSHTIPPHMINYRANLWALKYLGVRDVIAIAAVGGINPAIDPERLAIPDQIIDYTSGRAHTFFERELSHVTHIDFSYPYCESLRAVLIQAAREAQLDVYESGTYGATQGPRLETAAEIDRMARDGCDVVGMTGMPEAALARELELCYATCAVCANWAAGRSTTEITLAQIRRTLDQGMKKVERLLEAVIRIWG
ncbi:MAG TPA: S-methyl-5'-thioinosine phosphorylase [Gammaproteobacteria bacterium]|nr:S-methyl-5'-thioinosine phosphorylase [Gammaproteobacteria bacterium]